jgi:hypothetical protein
MPQPRNSPRRDALSIGTPVQVRTGYLRSWANGFKVAGPTNDGYWLRRNSDEYLLPRSFAAEEIRRDTGPGRPRRQGHE